MVEVSLSERFLKLNKIIYRNNNEKVYKAKDFENLSATNIYWHEIYKVTTDNKKKQQILVLVNPIEEWNTESSNEITNEIDIQKYLTSYYITNTPELLTENPLLEKLLVSIYED
jgi:hypothetical protein